MFNLLLTLIYFKFILINLLSIKNKIYRIYTMEEPGMGTYMIPRNTKGEGRILFIFSTKALIYTAVGARSWISY